MNYFFTSFRIVLLFVAVALFSIAIIPSLKVELLPGSNNYRLYVSVNYYANNPSVVEQQVTSVLENGLSQLQGLKQIKSVSRNNRGIVTLEFDPATNMQQKGFEVTSVLRQLHHALPAAASYPVVSGGNESRSPKSPLLIYTVNAPQQSHMIRKNTYEILNKLLAGKESISEVLVTGAPELQLSVVFDIERCRILETGPSRIIELMQSYLGEGFPGYAPAGNGQQYFLYMKTGASDISTIENIPLALKPGTVIRLKDVAKIYMEEQPARQFFRVNGKNSVFASIYAQEGQNRILMARDIKKMLSQKNLWPQEYEASLAFDDSEFLEKELESNYKRIMLSLGILVLFILFTYRNLRHLVTLTMALLINTCLTLILVQLTGIVIHIYTIAGMAISFGIILDMLIIMLDYYRQFRNRKVFTSMLASISILISGLMLVYLLPQEEQDNLKDLARVVCLSLLSSLAVCLWFVPGLYSLLHGHHLPSVPKVRHLRKVLRWQSYYAKTISFIAGRRIIFCLVIALIFGLPVFMLPKEWKGDKWYNDVYNKSIGSTTWQQSIQPVINKWLGGTSYSFTRNLNGHSGFRDPAQNRLFVEVALHAGNTPQQMNSILRETEKFLAGDKCIDKFVTRVYNGQSGAIEIIFRKEYKNTMYPARLKSRLVARSLEWGGIEWNIYGVGQAFNNSPAEENGRFSVTLKGYNYDKLGQQVESLADRLQTNKRVHKINTAELLEFTDRVSVEYLLALDAGKMALHNTGSQAVSKELVNTGYPFSPAGFASVNDMAYPVMLKEKNADQYSVYALLHQPLITDSNKAIRLNNLASLSIRAAANALYKENRQYIHAIGFNFLGPEESGTKYLSKVLDTFNRMLPPGYSAVKTKQAAGTLTDFSYGFLVFLLIAASFFICSVLFESLRQPFLIICTVPVCFIGLFIIFPAGNFFFDQGGYGAFVMLGGLVIGAAVFIVNDFNSLHKKKPVHRFHNKILVRAVSNRSRTILLTTLSNICGLIPFMAEGDGEVFWFSFAVGTVGGLVFSLIGLFIVLPVLLWRKQKKRLQLSS